MKLMQTVKRRMGNEDTSKPAAGSRGAEAPAKSKAASGSAKASAAPKAQADNLFAALPKLREAPPTERIDLFRKKMQVCSQVFDFSLDTSQREKEAKRQTLLEIVEYVNNTRNCFNEALMQDVVSMVGKNIFRSLPTKHRTAMSVYEPEDEEPTLERAWPHLQIVYEFFSPLRRLQRCGP
jgi:serine/threonine-protein phosphatase 2A regulatory subunit B'